MRKTLGLFAVLTIIGAAFVAGGAAGASRQAAATSFKFCDNPTFPPLESTTTGGKPVGFDIDMANALGKQMGGKATYVFSSFSGLLPALAAGRCDVVISGLFITPDRTKQFPAISYMKSHRALVVAGGNPKHISSPNALKGKNVAVQAATKYQAYLQGLQKKLGFTLHSYPGDTDAIGQILLGRSDAVLTQDTEAAYQITQHKGKLMIGYLFPQTDRFGIYYKRGSAIGGQLKSALAALKKNGTMASLAKKYNIPAGDVK